MPKDYGCHACGAPRLLRHTFILALVTLFHSYPAPVSGKTFSSDASFIDTTIPASIPREIIADWKIKDGLDTNTPDYSSAIVTIKSILPSRFASKIDTGLTEAHYLRACHIRRVSRIEPFSQTLRRLLCASHYDVGGPVPGCLEDLYDDIDTTSDGAAKKTWSRGVRYEAGSALLLLRFDNYYPAATPLLEDKTGVVRDPCLSFDGQRIAFAWSKDNNGYHIHEMKVDDPNEIRQLTFDLPGLTVSDYEPCYLPNDDIVFNSSRCVQGYSVTDNLVSNLFIMNRDGNYLRRICYDQAQNFHPTTTSDGKILFSRWEFMDRSPESVFGIFTMNPDGALQNEYFGNQLAWPKSWPEFAYTLPNAREIPGTGGKLLSIVGRLGMPVYQGDLAVIDPAGGRNNPEALRLIAPLRSVIDGDTGFSFGKFSDPYPLSASWFLISRTENPNIPNRSRLYLMDVDGNRELLAWDSNRSISQPFPVVKREAPAVACQADYSKSAAEIKMSNAYYGSGIDSTVKPGSIKKIRVIALDYRMYPYVGRTRTAFFTPVSRFWGSSEAKRILGEMKVESDGSAAIVVPARTPFYVQLIDSQGCMIQSMRSWMTLQPGEKFDCFGCHEDKNHTPPPVATAIARTAKALEPMSGLAGGYCHYPDVIQPLLDAKCVACHKAGHSSGLDLSREKIWTGDSRDFDFSTAQRFWCTSYLSLTDTLKNLVNYIRVNSQAQGLKPNTVGSGRSALITKLRAKSGAMKDVSLTTEEMAKLCAWIDLCIPHGGKYTDDMKSEDSRFYEQRLLLRKQEEDFEARNIAEFIRNGGYDNVAYGGTIQGVIDRGNTAGREAVRGRDFQIRFSRLSHRLIMSVPSAGSVTLVDLKGRRMAKFDISDNDYVHCSGTAFRALAMGVPAGLYIARFKGKALSAEKVVLAP